MNTKYNFARRLVLTISALFTALWLPLTAFAQDSPKAGDLTHSANTQAAECQRLLKTPTISNNRVREERVGFSETDPTDQQWRSVAAISKAFNNQAQQVYVGFSETDPTDQNPKNAMVVLQPSKHWVQQVNAGFSETDPVVDIHQSVGKIHNQTFVACHRGNAKDIALEASDFPGPIDRDSNHEHF
jgi:hypothetical protein